MSQNNDHKNEHMYHQLIGNIPDGFALHEIICNNKGKPVDYRFLEVNPAFEELTGLKATDIIGKTCLEVLPEIEPIWIQRYGKVALTGISDHFESYSSVLDRHFEVSAFRTAPDHFACLFHDITEHVKLKNTLGTSEQDLKEAQEIANIGHWKLDVVENILEWSDEIFKIFEIDKEGFEPSYESFLETIHPDDRETVNEAYTRSLKDKLPYDIEHRLLMKDGRIKWVNEICRSKFDKNGKPLRSVGIVQDITELKIAAEQTEKNIESLRLSESLTGIGYFERSWQTEEGYWSEGFYKLLGESPENVDCTHAEFMKYIHPDDSKRVTEHVQGTIKDHTDMDIEFRIVQVDGNIIDIHGRATNIYDEAGRPLSTIGTFLDITERKKANETLRENEEKYRSLVEGSIQGMVVAQKDPLRLSFASLPMERISGYSPEEITSFTPQEIVTLIHEDDREEFFNNFKSRISGGDVDPSKKYRLIHKKGSVVWVEVFSTVVQYNGEPAVQAAFIDISERKRAEESLRIILDTSPFPTAVVDIKDGTIKYWSKSAVNLTGYNPETVQEWYKLAYPDPDYRRKVVKRWETFLDSVQGISEAVNSGEYLITCKNGNVRTCELFAQFIPGYLIATLNDITERKKIEKDWAKSNEFLLSVINQTPFAIHILEGSFNNMNVVIENDESVRILGEKLQETKGINADRKEDLKTRFFTIDGKKEIPLNQMPGPRAFKGEISINKDFLFRHEDGTEIMVQASATPIYGTDDEIRAVIVIFHDITEKYKLESYLQKSQKLESLGILAGGIAHDFNNILSAIFGYTEMAMFKTSERETSDYLNKSLKNIERAQSLTRQLLTFAKGGTPVKKSAKLSPFLEETVNFALSGSSVTSNFLIQEDLWQCNFDKNQIGQVIDNLTINARQAMSDGGTIEINAKNVTISEKDHSFLPLGKYVNISIKDSGIGIPEEFLQKIFDPYYTTKPKGHGLGLATCYSIIKKHDGYIEVESEPGKGSTFSIFLPATDKPAYIENTTPVSQHKGSGIFIVMDDEESIRDIIREMLESFGYEVVLKTNGSETIDYLKEKAEENFEIAGMIFDLTIPGGIGGKEAVKEVKKLFPEVPVFVASGYSEDPIVSNPENYGFNASIRKPFMISDISEMLEKHMKKS